MDPKNNPIKILYRDAYNHIKGLQAVKLALDHETKIIGSYRSPNQTKEELVETIEFFRKLDDVAILIGDLKVPETDWTFNEIDKPRRCNDRLEKDELIYALTTESDRKQAVNFATNKSPPVN